VCPLAALQLAAAMGQATSSQCCRSVETFNKSIEKLMSIKSFVEIKFPE